ncbi:MAG: sodium:solute symporter family protein [Blastocatellia bacterium]
MTYLTILIAYALLMIAFGMIFSRRVTQTSDFFVAGRGLGAGLVFSTLLAANIGAGSTVGATGLGYRHGLSAWWWVGSAGIGSLFLAFTVGPRIWRIARENNLYTVGDYLEFRFSRGVRGLMAALLWLGSLTILAGQLIAIGLILNTVTGIGKAAGCMIGAGVTIVYFASGGLPGAARVNALQLIIKFIGFGLALGYLLDRTGGWSGMREAVAANPGVANAAVYLDPAGIGSHGVLRYLALLAPSFVISPGLLQKVFGARDERAVRKGVGLNALCLLGFAFVPALLGILARNQFPNLANPEMAMPLLLTEALPVWLGGLLLGAVFAAEVSTADAVLFMLSTSLARDLYQTFLRPNADDRQLMRAVRGIVVVCGVLGAGLGILLETVISALTIFYTLLSAALLLPLLAGLYTKRVDARAALAGMLVSVAATFLLERLTAGQGRWGLPSLILGSLAGLLVMGALSLRTPAADAG